MIASDRYRTIAAHYEDCLARHGDSHLGVDWPKADDVDVRHAVMLGLMRPRPEGESVQLLDFGCGASHFYEYIEREQIAGIEYSGLDISQRFVDLSQSKFPDNRYWCMDVLTETEASLPRFDYAVMNGVFTIKRELEFEEMFEFLKQVVTKVFALVDVGIAFNVMSSHVDWERDDLFHLPLDLLASWLTQNLTRNFVIRNDYGLYEYTTYVYR